MGARGAQARELVLARVDVGERVEGHDRRGRSDPRARTSACRPPPAAPPRAPARAAPRARRGRGRATARSGRARRSRTPASRREARRGEREGQPARPAGELEHPPRRAPLDQALPERQVEVRVVRVLELVELWVVPEGPGHVVPGCGTGSGGAAGSATGSGHSALRWGRTIRMMTISNSPAKRNIAWTPSVEISAPAATKAMHEGARGAGLVQREQPAVQRLGHRVGEQQAIVHEREAVAEAAERERHQHEPEERRDGAQDQVGGHADEPEHVGLAPLPAWCPCAPRRSSRGRCRRRTRSSARRGRSRRRRAARGRA